MIRPMILHHLIRMEHVRADLRAPGDFLLFSISFFLLRGALGHLSFVQTTLQHLHRGRTIFDLRALILTLHHDPASHVRDAHRRIRRVDSLPALTAGAKHIDTNICFFYFDINIVLNFRNHFHGGKRRMPAFIGIKRRDTHEAMHTDF